MVKAHESIARKSPTLKQLKHNASKKLKLERKQKEKRITMEEKKKGARRAHKRGQ